MNNGPRPSKRAFISDLPYLPPGTKVRFLGCVKTYIIRTGHLILEHNYPRPKASDKGITTLPCSVSVDINAVLETVKFEDLCVGAWVNVLGYVRHGHGYEQQQQQHPQRLQGKKDSKFSGLSSVYVDAVVIFSAGSVEIGTYERIVKDSQDVERRFGQPTERWC